MSISSCSFQKFPDFSQGGNSGLIRIMKIGHSSGGGDIYVLTNEIAPRMHGEI